jgi:DNA polymerase
LILDGDLETYCGKPIKHGTYQYAEACEVLLFFYGIDNGPVKVWDMTTDDPMPADLEHALEHADEIVFQNSMFDRSVFRLAKNAHPAMRKAGGEIHRWRDTMVQALAHSLPGGLEKLGDVLRVDQDKRKLDVGKQLIRLFCIPPAKNLKRGRATRLTHPVEWAQFIEYGEHDILAMREIRRKCPRWNYQGEELALWHLDQRINDRGVCVDLDLATAAIETVNKEQARLKLVTQDMTGYDAEAGTGVESATKRDKLLMYLLEEYGVVLPDLKKDTLERRVDDPDLPIELRNLLAIRLMASTSSTSKYQAVARGTSSDGRLRGLLQFNGASRTGRWAGRTFQPQNLMRPDMEQEEIDLGIEAIKVGSADLVFDNVMRVCANAMRGVIIAPPGKKLVVGDLANIEGRMAAWLTGENWKLKAFAEYDAGVGPDLYKVAYAKAFAITPDEVGKPERQIGKVMELMLQYEGGVGAFITGAATYGIDLDEMAEAALPAVPGDVFEESKGFYDWTVKQKRSTFGLPRETFIACDALKRLWRRAHNRISFTWPALKAAATEAINNPGVWVEQGSFWQGGLDFVVPIKTPFRRDGAWLKCRLPSGRFICYPSPQVDDKGAISYMGVNQYSRQWSRIKTYGGKIFENITQAAARDVLAHGMVLSENNGYEVVLSVHDELITEAPDTDAYSTGGLCALMATVPDWAEGIPLSSAGFEGHRYKKD